MTLSAAVVGAGLNGLTAACELARAGWEVTVYEQSETPGGAARSAELFGPGLISDLGASIHPISAASIAYEDLLGDAIDWVHPPIPAAHGMDDGAGGSLEPALLHTDLETTAQGLGEDADLWRWVIGSAAANWDGVRQALFTPPTRPWTGLSQRVLSQRLCGSARRLGGFAQLGTSGIMSATNLMRAFRTERAKALFAGLAAHSTGPLNHPLTSVFGVIFGAAAHAGGWPAVRGGTQQIVDALVEKLTSLGGEIVTGFNVTGVHDVPLPSTRHGVRKDLSRRGWRLEGTQPSAAGRRQRSVEQIADVVLLNQTPAQILQLDGLPLNRRQRKRLQGWEYGPGLVKIDYLINGPIPWTHQDMAQAGTVHLGGSGSQLAASEAAANRGILPTRPYVLVAQPAAADPTRTPDHRTVAWAYAHVPHGLDGAGVHRAVQLVEDEITRQAPEFRDVVLERNIWSPQDLETWNPNLVGGSLSGGLPNLTQLFAGPVSLSKPYAGGADGVYIASSSAPPGGGAHGVAGYQAARTALREKT